LKKIKKGFTLIELLVVIGIIGILAAIVLVAVNPGRQFALARDTQRRSDLLEITNAIYEFAAEHNGNLPDTDNDDATSNFPDEADGPTCIGTPPCFNLAEAGKADTTADPDTLPDNPVVPTYIAGMPYDPSTGTAANTQYTIYVNSGGRIVASASGELTTSISVEK